MKLRYTIPALDDLDANHAYLNERNPRAAAQTILRIRDAARGLKEHPEMGRPGRVAETRELVVADTPYVVAYRIHADAIQILRVLHGAMRWPRNF